MAYHGSFRENLESAFWGLDLFVDPAVLRSLEASAEPQARGKGSQLMLTDVKIEALKRCNFDASPQSEWLITAHLERIWNQHFGALECHIAA